MDHMRVFSALLLALLLALAGCGKEKRVVMFPPPTQQDLARGALLFQAQCALCHGQPTRGNPPIFRPLTESFIVKGDGMAFVSTVLKSGDHRDPRNGASYFNHLNDKEVSQIANYLRNLADEDLSPVRAHTVRQLR